MPLDLFKKTELQQMCPPDMEQIIFRLQACKDKISCLRMAYDELVERFHWDRLKTFLHLKDLFAHNLDYLWSQQFLHCTNSNYLLRHLLIASGHFREKDIELRWTLIFYISPHQYVKALVDGKRIDVDIWASSYGIAFGDHSHWFHWSLFRKIWKIS